MSHSYPSDISREQFVRILPTGPTKPRTVDLYDVFCGLYLLKSGCQWRIVAATRLRPFPILQGR